MRLDALIEARVTTRKPAAYLLNRAYIQGVPFYVDERVIVPRSFIGELLMTAFAGENALTGDPASLHASSISAPAAARSRFSPRKFSQRAVDAADLSPDASRSRGATSKSRARRARDAHQGDLFAPLGGSATISSSPIRPMSTPGFGRLSAGIRRRARMAHAGGADGLDIVRRILARGANI